MKAALHLYDMNNAYVWEARVVGGSGYWEEEGGGDEHNAMKKVNVQNVC